MMNVNDFNTDQRLNTLIENENSYLYRHLKQWFDKVSDCVEFLCLDCLRVR